MTARTDMGRDDQVAAGPPAPPFEERLGELRRQTSEVDAAIAGKRFLVIGGTGFLGRYLVEEVLARGAAEARILCRTPPRPLADDDPGRDARVTYATGSVSDPEVVSEACRGVDVVFHTAAAYGQPPFGRFGKAEAVYAANVGGVENVIAGCRARGVRTLIYTSSVNVIFDGRTRLEADEATPYPAPRRQDHYSRSKVEGERRMLAAHGGDLATCVLRPNGIYGPRETFITGKVLGLARRMRGLPFSLNPRQRTDWTFVYNLVWAHLLAVAKLERSGEGVGGEAFFITDGEPLHTMRGFVDGFLRPLGLPVRPLFPVPSSLMVLGCLLVEWLCHLLAPLVRLTPPFTKAEALKSVTSHTHSGERAARLLGYRPLVSTREGLHYMNEDLRERAVT